MDYFSLVKADCTRLDLSGCSKLDYVTIADVPLTKLDLPASVGSVTLNRVDLERLEVKGAIDETRSATNFHIENCERLKRLDFSSGLWSIHCENCPALTEMNLGDCRGLSSFTCTGTALSSLDLSQRGVQIRNGRLQRQPVDDAYTSVGALYALLSGQPARRAGYFRKLHSLDRIPAYGDVAQDSVAARSG